MNNLLKKINSYLFGLVVFGLMLVAAMLPYYADNHIILGREGNFVINFKILLDNLKYTWLNVMTGFPLASMNFMVFNVFCFYFLQELIPDLRMN